MEVVMGTTKMATPQTRPARHQALVRRPGETTRLSRSWSIVARYSTIYTICYQPKNEFYMYDYQLISTRLSSRIDRNTDGHLTIQQHKYLAVCLLVLCTTRMSLLAFPHIVSKHNNPPRSWQHGIKRP